MYGRLFGGDSCPRWFLLADTNERSKLSGFRRVQRCSVGTGPSLPLRIRQEARFGLIDRGSLLRCVGPQHARDLGLRAEVDATSADWRYCDRRGGVG